MMYRATSKIKGVNSEQLTGKVQEFILRNVSGNTIVVPDVWCDFCRKFASENGYDVSFTIDKAYTLVDGQLADGNAIISTFKLKK